MVEKTNSDVDRALEAFGGSALKYRSFGSFTPKPGQSAISPPVIPIDDADVDPFATVQPASAQPAHPQPIAPSQSSPNQADTFYPLLGAAMPEASSVAVQAPSETATRRQAAAARASLDDFPIAQAPFPPRQVRPATAYVPPTTPPASAPPPPPAAPAPRPYVAPPPEPVAVTPPPAPVLETPAPTRAVVSTPVAERGWVPPPPLPEPAPIPPAPVPAPAPPPPVAKAPEVAPVPPRDIPQPVPAVETRPSHALGDHFERVEAPVVAERRDGAAKTAPSGGGSDAVDRRSLAEMFRVLSGSSEPPRPQAAPIGRFPDEEPGLFRRL